MHARTTCRAAFSALTVSSGIESLMLNHACSEIALGYSQNHLAVAGGCKRSVRIASSAFDFVPTRYREVVLTVPKPLRGTVRASTDLAVAIVNGK